MWIELKFFSFAYTIYSKKQKHSFGKFIYHTWQNIGGLILANLVNDSQFAKIQP